MVNRCASSGRQTGRQVLRVKKSSKPVRSSSFEASREEEFVVQSSKFDERPSNQTNNQQCGRHAFLTTS